MTLRWRATLAFTLLGALLSVLFAGATVFIAEDYEHVIVDEILRGQAEDYDLRLSSTAEAVLPRTHRLSGYLRAPDGTGEVPPDIAALPPGIHESEDESQDGMHIGVFDSAHGRLYFVIDLSDIESLERHLATYLILVVVLGTLISGWLGWWFAGATLAPVRVLAKAVDALAIEPVLTSLAVDTGPGELGRLAHAIDRYQARLVDAEASERAFFADASHELRTPVAVVRGAVEVLNDQAELDPATRQRVQRIDRGVGELGELIDVLMCLVRRREQEMIEVDAAQMLHDAAAPIVASIGEAHLRVVVGSTVALRLPLRESLLVLQGVLRRLLPPTSFGTLTMSASPAAIDLIYAAGAIHPAMPSKSTLARSDLGLGLTLVGRLANRIGWRIEERAGESGVRAVRIILG